MTTDFTEPWTPEIGKTFTVIPDSEPTQLDRIEANSAETLATMKRIEEMVTNTFADVKPTLDSLMEHPMLKMLGMGGKKKS